MKVLVTGGSGFAGSLLVEKLLNFGHFVRVLDNGQRNNCDSLLGFVNNPNFEFIYGTINDSHVMSKVFNDITHCVHLAAAVGMPITTKFESYSWLVNYGGTNEILSYRPNHVKLVFASTGSIYGALKEICTEEITPNPLSPYGKQKWYAEQDVIKAGNSTALRYATAYGISRNTRLDLLINDLTYRAIKEKTLTVFQADFGRTFIHISDFCDAIIYAFNHWEKFDGEVFNVGDDNNNWTKRQIAEYLKTKTGCSVFYADEGFTDPDARNYVVSHAKVNAVGFKCQVSMEEGIAQLIKGIPILGIGNSRYQDKLL